jgi:hypothetical protein
MVDMIHTRVGVKKKLRGAIMAAAKGKEGQPPTLAISASETSKLA